MKRRHALPIIIISLLLVASLLCGCASDWLDDAVLVAEDMKGLFSGAEEREKIPSFDNIKYVRPNILELKTLCAGVTSLLAEGNDIKQVEKLLDECYACYYRFTTMHSVAEIRSCRNITDEYYAEEYAYCSDVYTEMQSLFKELFHACAVSPLGSQLEEDYFWEGFCEENSREDAGYPDSLMKLFAEENRLLTQYRAILSSTEIEYDGMIGSYDELYADAPDSMTAGAITDAFYQKYSKPLAEKYIELVKVRRQIALELGYDSYEQMQYEYSFERDYTPQQAEKYLEDIRLYVAPLYKEVMALSPYSRVSYDYLSQRKLTATVQTAAESMGGTVREAFDFMVKHNFCDLAVDAVKANMSFQSYLDYYDAPYLFLDACGDTEDILSLFHELGHYTDAYYNRNAFETVDVAEVFSQSMEYLALSHLKGAADEGEINNLKLIKLLDTLELYIQQAAFAEFEHIVYSADEETLTVDFLNSTYLELSMGYGFGTKEDGAGWCTITHFFEYPFYVISYPVSCDGAWQIYSLENDNAGAGLEKFNKLLPRDYTGIIETMENGGLESPFAPNRVKTVAKQLREEFKLLGIIK